MIQKQLIETRPVPDRDDTYALHYYIIQQIDHFTENQPTYGLSVEYRWQSMQKTHSTEEITHSFFPSMQDARNTLQLLAEHSVTPISLYASLSELCPQF